MHMRDILEFATWLGLLLFCVNWDVIIYVDPETSEDMPPPTDVQP